MALSFYYHPLSSYCQKALIALYENDTPFEPVLIDLREPDSRAKLTDLWPISKFPVLKDGEWVVPESSIIIEYLDQNYPGPTRFLPADPQVARQVRMRDRFFDLYVDETMAKIVGDRMRPEGKTDPFGVDQARTRLETALSMVDNAMAAKTWAMGDAFTLADCAAAPALFYANMLAPFEKRLPNAGAYLKRLCERPSFARCLAEAKPYLDLIPKMG
jgi:glutathione S-transferase